MKLLAVRSGAFGLYRPVCAITSINRFHVRVCVTSERARAIASGTFSVSSPVAKPTVEIALAAAAVSLRMSALVKAGCALVAFTISCAAGVASAGATLGYGLGVGTASISFLSALCKIAAITGTFFVLRLTNPARG